MHGLHVQLEPLPPGKVCVAELALDGLLVLLIVVRLEGVGVDERPRAQLADDGRVRVVHVVLVLLAGTNRPCI